MSKIFFYGATTKHTTDQTGKATICVKIPGIFSGIDGFSVPPANGRYVKAIQIWTENGAAGDRIDSIRLEDIDGVAASLAPMFQSYPVIQAMYDTDIVVSDTTFSGIAIPVSQSINVSAIDPIDSRGLQFIPSGFYLCADFISGDSMPNKIIRMNYIWGKYF